MEDVSQEHVAMVRGVRNCGHHHEEDATRPAVEFALGCDQCAGKVFAVIYNCGINAMAKEAVRQVHRHTR